MANACIAVTIPETNGVPEQYCDAPCTGDYCKDHAYLDEFGIDSEYLDYVGDSDVEYDRVVDHEMGM